MKLTILELTTINQIDLNRFLAITKNESLLSYLENLYCYELEDAKIKLNELFKNKDDEFILVTGIYLDNTLIGIIKGYSKLLKKEKKLSLIYFLDSNHQGNNYMTLALTKYIELVRKKYKTLNYISAIIIEENKASIRVVENCGFYVDQIIQASDKFKFLIYKLKIKEP